MSLPLLRLRLGRLRPIVVACVLVNAGAAQARAASRQDDRGLSSAAARARLTAAYGKLPLGFEPNRGQVDARVNFLSRGFGYDLFLTGSAAVLELRSPRAVAAPGTPRGARGQGEPLPAVALQMKLLNTAGGAAPVGQGRLPGRVSYLEGNRPGQWHRQVETFSAVRYPQIYRGIDLVYYGNRGALEYDFVVAPGADPARISLQFEGGSRPRVDSSGDLVIDVGVKAVRFRGPVVYQDGPAGRRTVNGRFTIRANGEVGFELGSYDRARAVVIDPVLAYASYLGGTTQETTIYGMAVNAAGQMFVTGQTNALDFPTTTGVLQGKCPTAANGTTKCGVSSQSTAFVSKISADGGSMIYSTYLGGSGAANGGEGADVGIAVAVDGQDNAYVVGTTYSNNFPVTADALQPLCSPVAASFDFTANQYVGKRAGCAFVNNGGEYVFNSPDTFVVKLDPTGANVLYGTFLGGSGNDSPVGVALDAAGNIYVGGSTSSTIDGPFATSGAFAFPVTPSAFQAVGIKGNFAAYLTVLSANGHSLLYSSVIGGGNLGACGNGMCSNTSTALAVAPATGIAYLTGFSSSAAFPTTAGAFQTTCPADASGVCSDTAFVAAFDPTKTGAASLVYSTRLNGALPARPTTLVNAIAVDASGNTYLTGTTGANDFPTTSGGLQPACSHANLSACNDAFVAKLNATGTALTWSTLYGSKSGCCTVVGTAVALDASQNVFVAGTNGGAYDLVQKSPFQPGEAGNQDVFLLELNPAGSEVLFGSYFGAATGNELPSGLAVRGASDLYFAGTTTSSDLPVTANAFDKTSSGGFPTGFVAHASLTGGPPGDGGAGDADGSTDAPAHGAADAQQTDAALDGAGGDAENDAGGPRDASADRSTPQPHSGCGCELAESGTASVSLLAMMAMTMAIARPRRRRATRRPD